MSDVDSSHSVAAALWADGVVGVFNTDGKLLSEVPTQPSPESLRLSWKLRVEFAMFRSQMIVGRRWLVFAQKLRLKPVCLQALIDVLAFHLQLDR